MLHLIAKVMIILDCCHRALDSKPVSHACGIPFLHLTVLKNNNVKSYNQKLQSVRKQWTEPKKKREPKRKGTEERERENQRERREEPNRKNGRTKENEREPKRKRTKRE